jgi:aminoglycoside phosphotransferase family enzyme
VNDVGTIVANLHRAARRLDHAADMFDRELVKISVGADLALARKFIDEAESQFRRIVRTSLRKRSKVRKDPHGRPLTPAATATRT